MNKFLVTTAALMLASQVHASENVDIQNTCTREAPRAVLYIQDEIKASFDESDKKIDELSPMEQKRVLAALGITKNEPVVFTIVGDAIGVKRDGDITFCAMRLDSTNSRIRNVKKKTHQKSLPFVFAVRPNPDGSGPQIGIVNQTK